MGRAFAREKGLGEFEDEFAKGAFPSLTNGARGDR